jgi:hypothetical protein
MTPAALRQLAGLAEARRQRDLAAVERLMAEMRRLDAEIAEIAGTLTRDMAAEAPVPMMNYGRRMAWAEHETALRRAAQARLAAQLAAARAMARVSLGKHEALLKLVEAAEAGARQDRERKAEREGFVGLAGGAGDWTGHDDAI